MTVHPDADFVREVVVRIFGQSGWQAASLEGLTEMILISDGKYRGRSYRAAGLLAMWLADMGLLQIYDRQGHMLRTVNLFEEQTGLQKAA
ncbi:MAG TPA: hypothetical protein VHV55_01305 [Pirellulales bacterium]|jgi:hypothetical protein|nr:hypothetical protein [Pirellulales bacterium]